MRIKVRPKEKWWHQIYIIDIFKGLKLNDIFLQICLVLKKTVTLIILKKKEKCLLVGEKTQID